MGSSRGFACLAVALVAGCGAASSAARPGGGGTSAAAPSGGGGGGRAASVVCGPAGAPTLGASSVARVYSSSGEVFGCSRAAAGAIRLGQTRSCIGHPQIGPVKVRGELAAYGVRRCGVDTGQASVVVRRLDTRRVLHDAAAITGATGPESYGQVDSLVLAPGGSAAWIATSSSIVGKGSGRTEVHAIDRIGSHLLDSGSAIAVASLRLRGSNLSWRHGARTRAARLR